MALDAFHLIPAVAEITFIDVILSGDNAVVIALATRSLPPDLRRIAVLVGVATSLVMRIAATGVVGWLLAMPYLKLLAAAGLLYVAVKLLVPDESPGAAPAAAEADVWDAIRLIVFADLAMSLDNVLAVAGAADGSLTLLTFGLLLSMPLLVFGSRAMAALMDAMPLLIPLGGGLLGWIAGGIAVTDPAIADFIDAEGAGFIVVAPVAGAVFVMVLGRALSRRMLDRAAEIHPA